MANVENRTRRPTSQSEIHFAIKNQTPRPDRIEDTGSPESDLKFRSHPEKLISSAASPVAMKRVKGLKVTASF